MRESCLVTKKIITDALPIKRPLKFLNNRLCKTSNAISNVINLMGPSGSKGKGKGGTRLVNCSRAKRVSCFSKNNDALEAIPTTFRLETDCLDNSANTAKVNPSTLPDCKNFPIALPTASVSLVSLSNIKNALFVPANCNNFPHDLNLFLHMDSTISSSSPRSSSQYSTVDLIRIASVNTDPK